MVDSLKLITHFNKLLHIKEQLPEVAHKLNLFQENMNSRCPIMFEIKSVTNHYGATCQNNNHFERPTILNAP